MNIKIIRFPLEIYLVLKKFHFNLKSLSYSDSKNMLCIATVTVLVVGCSCVSSTTVTNIA